MKRDIVDEIDALVDEQLAGGEPRTGFDFGDPTFPDCPHCGRRWHGLPITPRIATMYALRTFDEDYRAATDHGPVLCPGSDFIGPMPAPDIWPPKSDLSGWGSLRHSITAEIGDGAPGWLEELINTTLATVLDTVADLIGFTSDLTEAMASFEETLAREFGLEDALPVLEYRRWLPAPPENRRLPMPLEYARPIFPAL